MKKKIRNTVYVLLILLLIVVLYMLNEYKFFDQTIHKAEEFGFIDLISPNDYDQDGIDDYMDILISSRKYIKSKPKYKSKYYSGGYPDDRYGVCTDVVWNGLLGAGYRLKDLIDEDIKKNPSAYPTIENKDPNIDFRRVRNLRIFFERYFTVLTNDVTKVEEFQPGDIVVFSNHIGILSDKRNRKGLPFLIHHDNAGARERNELDSYTIIGHYRLTSPIIISNN